MKVLFAASSVALLLAMGAQAAPPSTTHTSSKPSASASQSTAQVLQSGVRAMVANATGRPADTSQGADHASIIALQRVCSLNTPAAQRSAICRSNSPE
jgi:hypothetical protein